MEVYLDILMLLNFLVDFLLLTGTNRLAGFPPGAGRAALAAALGAEGDTVVSGLCHIDRGYEDLEGVIRGLGGRIARKDEG